MHIVQAWGMTETSPLAADRARADGRAAERGVDLARTTGRVMAGVEMRIVDDDGDGPAVGRRVGRRDPGRGPWITGAYHLDDDPEKFHDGWLRTGDVAPSSAATASCRSPTAARTSSSPAASGSPRSTSRTRSWAHPTVLEAAVVAVPDERWDERPLACVVLRPGTSRRPDELRSFLSDKVARWWLPERWTFIDEVPKTSVGKFDKKVLRRQYADDELTVEQLAAVST